MATAHSPAEKLVRCQSELKRQIEINKRAKQDNISMRTKFKAAGKLTAKLRKTTKDTLDTYNELTKALYEWEYPKQLRYTQILREKIGEVMAGASTLAEAVDPTEEPKTEEQPAQ
jgi:hypothetical protein